MKRRLAVLFAATAITLSMGGARADGSVEYAVKGTFLYKFLPFVQWPASAFAAPNSPITICILGRDPFGSALDKAVADQVVETHLVVVKRGATLSDLPACQAVFVSLANPEAQADAVHAFDGKPVLTVTDSTASPAGVIGFVVEQNHVRFDIDDALAARDGLTISSKLLTLARKVTPRKAGP